MQKKRGPKPSQPGLFQPVTQMPTLRAMPPEVQQKTIELMSRLLRQHREGQRSALRVKEGGHE